MTLKAVVDSLDGIAEALHAEYIEKDGKFYLDLDQSLTSHTSITALTRSLAAVRGEKAALATKVTALEARVAGLPDDFDPAKYAEVLTELETLKNDPNRDKDAEKRLTSLRDQYDQRLRTAEEKRLADLKAKDDEIAERDAVIENRVAGGGLTEALVKAGVAKEFLDAATALLRPKVKIKKDDKNERIAFVETDMGEVDVAAFVDSWSKSDAGKPFVPKPTGSGGNGSGGGGAGNEVNPWSDKTINRTEQGILIRTNRPKAERLMKAAGLKPEQISAVLG